MIFFPNLTSNFLLITILLSNVSYYYYVNCYQVTNIPQVYNQQRQPQNQQHHQKYYSKTYDKSVIPPPSTPTSTPTKTKSPEKSPTPAHHSLEEETCNKCETEGLLTDLKETSFLELSNEFKEELLFASIGLLIGVERDAEISLA